MFMDNFSVTKGGSAARFSRELRSLRAAFPPYAYACRYATAAAALVFFALRTAMPFFSKPVALVVGNCAMLIGKTSEVGIGRRAATL